MAILPFSLKTFLSTMTVFLEIVINYESPTNVDLISAPFP